MSQCICLPTDCCTLCSTFSCDCGPESNCMKNMKNNCTAHVATETDNYHEPVMITLDHSL